MAHNLAEDKMLVIGDFNAKKGQPKTEEHQILGGNGYGI